jgi:hypothetical protein
MLSLTACTLAATIEDWRRVEIDGRIPMGRFAHPEDIAEVIFFFSAR